MIFLDQHNTRAVAQEFGTPIYVYSEKLLREAANECLAFPNAFGLHVRYAMKANPNASILRLFRDMGLYFDASSGFEARRAMMIGIEAEKISLSTQELPLDFAELVNAGIEVNCCSINQLERYGQAFPNAEVGIRLNPGEGSGANNRTNTGGTSSSFGIWFEKIPQILEIAEKYGLKIVRIHTHIGSGGDPEKWFDTATQSLQHIEKFPQVHTIDLGGGFKVARMDDEPQADLQVIGKSVKKAFKEVAERTGRKLQLEIEPGTFLSANVGCIVSRVQDMTDTGDKGYTFIKTDTGMTEIQRPSMYGSRHPITVFPKNETQETANYVVSGHCCESGDILTPKDSEPEVITTRELAKTNIGDLIVIGGAGGYCSSMPAKNYNSFPEAPELLQLEDGSFKLIRKRQNLEQVIQNEIL